jgi:hypothetical protein
MKATVFSRLAAHMLTVLFCVLVMESCDDEETSIVTISFEEEFQTINEGEEATIRLSFDHPAAANGEIKLMVETDAVYQQSYVTEPALGADAVIVLPVNKGEEGAEVKLTSVNDDKYRGSQFAVFRMFTLSPDFRLGNTTTHTVTIHDDEGPSIPFFQSARSELSEDGETSQKVTIRLSSPAAGVGSLLIGLNSGKAVPGTHFTVDQELTNNTFTLKVEEGDTEASFEISPIDNNVFNGDFDLQFDILKVSGVVQITSTPQHILTLKDDEKPSIVQFVGTSATVEESNATPQVIDLTLSSPVKGEGTVKIRMGKGAQYGVDFVTVPEAQGNSVVIDLSYDETHASFEVFILDDHLLNGNLSIVFSIDEGTGPIQVGTEDQLYTLAVIENERPSVAEFVASALAVDESASAGIDVEIQLSGPAPGSGQIIVEVMGLRDQAATDPPVERIYVSDFGEFVEQITIDVPDGAESAGFHVYPVDNSLCEGNDRLRFKLSSATSSLEIGSKNASSVSILEDEPHLSAVLVETEGILAEDAVTGVKVGLKFPDPPSEGSSIIVYPDSYGFVGRYRTVPDLLVQSSEGDVFGYLNYQSGATGVGFEIFAVDDNLSRGDFIEMISFSGIGDGHCFAVENGPYVLHIVEDD